MDLRLRYWLLESANPVSMGTEHITDRSDLRFAETVKEHFSFLKALGFSCVSFEQSFVRFESSKASIHVYHGH